jgi:YVTN family beta-propeller protein
VLAAAATALAISLTRSGEGGISSVVQGNSLAAIDAATGRVVAEVPVGAEPAAVAVGGDSVWVLNADDQTISRVDANTKEVRTLAIGATPTDIAANAESVWVGNGGKLARAQFAGTTAVALTWASPELRRGLLRAQRSSPALDTRRSWGSHFTRAPASLRLLPEPAEPGPEAMFLLVAVLVESTLMLAQSDHWLTREAAGVGLVAWLPGASQRDVLRTPSRTIARCSRSTRSGNSLCWRLPFCTCARARETFISGPGEGPS